MKPGRPIKPAELKPELIPAEQLPSRDRHASEMARRVVLQAEIDAMEYRCGGMSDAQFEKVRRELRDKIASRRKPLS